MNLHMRFPGGRAKALTLSYDDGVEQDIRLLELMEKRSVKGAFNLNSGLYAKEGTVYPAGHVHRRMTRKMCLRTFASPFAEVALHGSTHPFLEQLPPPLAMRDILDDRARLESDFHRIVRGMAYPYGTYSDDVKEILRRAGVAYARTVSSSRAFSIPTDWLALRPTCHHNDAALFDLTDAFLAPHDGRMPKLFYLWGHSYEFETDGNWARIESFLDRASGHADVWYATNIELYDYMKAYESLVFSLDGARAYNPTATEVCLARDGDNFTLAPGAEIILR